MNTLVISDLSMEVVGRRLREEAGMKVDFVFSDDIVNGLRMQRESHQYDIVYIHVDAYFKQYPNDYLESLLSEISSFGRRRNGLILCSNILNGFWDDVPMSASIGTQGNAILRLSDFIADLNGISNLFFLDTDGITSEYGRANCYNFNLGYLYQMPYTKTFLHEFTKLLIRTTRRLFEPDRKVIILDCDNTLWGGIVGEDGIEEIACDLNSKGIHYHHLQRFLLSRKDLGFLLCLCSKNNAPDVEEAFTNKTMPLKWDDFTIRKVNWTNKEDNIREIAEELNLGTDSFIFIDDNEFELSRIRETFPEIAIFKMEDDHEALEKLSRDVIFSKKYVSEEDRDKSRQYTEESKRKMLENTSSSFEEYVKSLALVLNIDEDSQNDLVRVSQLTEKTNQFNFNKKPYTPETLKDSMGEGNLKIFSLKVSDKFGDYGLVGVILVETSGQRLVMENFIMSCRALGRGVERDFFRQVSERLTSRYGRGFDELRFVETKKNAPAKHFHSELTGDYGK